MSYNRNNRNVYSRRGTFTYWLPLALTLTAATIGVAAWIWSERKDDDGLSPGPSDNDHVHSKPGRQQNSDGNLGIESPSDVDADVRPADVIYGSGSVPVYSTSQESQSYMARMSGALRRTPSPQQIFDGASRSIVGGITAAGAAVGNALGSIIEEDKNAYIDHRTWSEEAATRDLTPSQGIELRSEDDHVPPVSKIPAEMGKRKTVAIVLSAEQTDDFEESNGEFHEHVSILSHLPHQTDFAKIRLFILIYAPGLKEHPRDVTLRPGSLSSSFSNIGHEQAQAPGEEVEHLSYNLPSPTFNAIYSQAVGLVENETMVLPFTTPRGHVHILRHLGPEVVYLQDCLAGNDGEVITKLQSWLRQDVIVVIGDGGGSGGLADSESDAGKREHWWNREERVGRGRGVIVVEAFRVGDDWARRVEGRKE